MKTNPQYIKIYRIQVHQFLRKMYGCRNLYRKRMVSNENLTFELRKLERETIKSKINPKQAEERKQKSVKRKSSLARR